LIVSLIGRVPGRREIIKHPAGVEFEIIDGDPRRIKRLRVQSNLAGLEKVRLKPARPRAEPDPEVDPDPEIEPNLDTENK